MLTYDSNNSPVAGDSRSSHNWKGRVASVPTKVTKIIINNAMISDVSAIIILIANPPAVDLARGLHPEDDNKDSEGCRPPAEKQAGEGSVP